MENKEKKKQKQYESRDAYINDDGLTNEDKIEICENLIEVLEENEREM